MPVNFYKDQIHLPPIDRHASIKPNVCRKPNLKAPKSQQPTHQAAKQVLAASTETEVNVPLSKRKAKRQRQANNKLKNSVNETKPTNNHIFDIERGPSLFQTSLIGMSEKLCSLQLVPENTPNPKDILYKGAKLYTKVTYPLALTAYHGSNLVLGAANAAKSWTAMALYGMYVGGGISNTFELEPMPCKVLGGFTNAANSVVGFAATNLLPMVQSGAERIITNPFENTRLGIASASIGTGIYYASKNFINACDSKKPMAKALHGTLAALNLTAAAVTPHFLYNSSASYLGLGVASTSTAFLYYASFSFGEAMDNKSYFEKIKHGVVASACLTVSVAVPYFINPFTN